MALTDNLVVKVKAESGQTVITDSVNAFSWSGGTGSAALINDGTYGYLWRITGGTRTATLSGLGNWTDTTAKATTIALRFRITGRAANYQKYAIFGQSVNNGQFIGNAGTSTGNLRATLVLGGSPVTNHALFAYTTGDVMTLVHRFQETGTTSDITSGWKNGGAGHPTPDATATNSVSSATLALIYSEFGVASGETLDILNFAAWNRGLTDSEAASVADDIAQLWGAASPATSITATLGNITGSVTSKPVPKTTITATLASVSSLITSVSGSVSTTISATLANITGAITSTGNTTNGTFTSEVLKDYAGNVLASVSLNYVRFYNDTTGALVLNKTGVTTNASGIVTLSDSALVAGTTYRVDWETSAGSRRMPRKAAA